MNHKYHVIVAAATLALAGVCFEVHAIGPTPPSWEPRELVADDSDWTNHAGSDRYLAYDHHGNAAIAFTNGELQFARDVPGSGWVYGDVNEGFDALGGGKFPSLAFDRYELPNISAARISGDHVGIHRYDNVTGWVTNLIGTFTSDLQHSALAFDVLGRAAVAYVHPDASWLVIIRDNDGDLQWNDESFEIVNDSPGVGRQLSMVFDPLNRPMIAHLNTNSNNLQFSVREPGIGWITTTVEEWGFFNVVGRFPSIAIDPDTGFPAIAYTAGSDSAFVDELHFAQWDGAVWDITVVDEGGITGTGIYPSLAFDPADGNPAISYQDQDNKALKLAWHDGTQWNTQTVDSVGDVGYSTSLAFNDFGTGFPSIAYFEEDGATDNIYFIEDPLPVPEPGTFLLAGLGLLSLGRSAWPRRTRPRQTASIAADLLWKEKS